jgi:hypothetical protein
MTSNTKEEFVNDMDNFDILVCQKLWLWWKLDIMSALQCSAEEAEIAAMKNPDIIHLLEQWDAYLTKYWLISVWPERVIINDFTRFKTFVETLSPEEIEASWPRMKNEFRFMFRNKILTWITNQLAWIWDITDPESLQTNYLLDVLAERPALRKILKEKNLDQDTSFHKIDEILLAARHWVLQEYKQANKKLLLSQDSWKLPAFYNANSLEGLIRDMWKSNTREYNNWLMQEKIERLEWDLKEIGDLIAKVWEKGNTFLLETLSTSYKQFISQQIQSIPKTLEELSDYPVVKERLTMFLAFLEWVILGIY